MSMTDRIEAKWIDSFVEVFLLCGVKPGDACAILSETQSRASLVQLSELALARLGARWFHVVLPTPRQTAPVPVRSTGASDAIGQLRNPIGETHPSGDHIHANIGNKEAQENHGKRFQRRSPNQDDENHHPQAHQ